MFKPPLRGPLSAGLLEPLLPTTEVLIPDPDIDLNPAERAAKRRRILDHGHRSLAGIPPPIHSASLRGDFRGWKNPWNTTSNSNVRKYENRGQLQQHAGIETKHGLSHKSIREINRKTTQGRSFDRGMQGWLRRLPDERWQTEAFADAVDMPSPTLIRRLPTAQKCTDTSKPTITIHKSGFTAMAASPTIQADAGDMVRVKVDQAAVDCDVGLAASPSRSVKVPVNRGDIQEAAKRCVKPKQSSVAKKSTPLHQRHPEDVAAKRRAFARPAVQVESREATSPTSTFRSVRISAANLAAAGGHSPQQMDIMPSSADARIATHNPDCPLHARKAAKKSQDHTRSIGNTTAPGDSALGASGKAPSNTTVSHHEPSIPDRQDSKAFPSTKESRSAEVYNRSHNSTPKKMAFDPPPLPITPFHIFNSPSPVKDPVESPTNSKEADSHNNLVRPTSPSFSKTKNNASKPGIHANPASGYHPTPSASISPTKFATTDHRNGRQHFPADNNYEFHSLSQPTHRSSWAGVEHPSSLSFAESGPTARRRKMLGLKMLPLSSSQPAQNILYNDAELEHALDDACSFLQSWSVESEMRKMAAMKSGQGSQEVRSVLAVKNA